ncbi:ribosome maturation factor RimP, partial [Acidithiobacillus ferriphilus]
KSVTARHLYHTTPYSLTSSRGCFLSRFCVSCAKKWAECPLFVSVLGMVKLEDRLYEGIAQQVGVVGCALVDARMVRVGRAVTLQIFIEKDETTAVTIEDCAAVSRQLSLWLDVENPVNAAYRLEVSSPGLDRPLKNLHDFERFKGSQAEIHLQGLTQGRRRVQGELLGVEDQKVVLKNAEGRWAFALGEIHKARLVPQW